MRSLAWSAVVVAALVLAGCVSPAPSPAPAAASSTVPAGEFRLSATDCVESGFVAAYNSFGDMPVLAGVWQTADVREEIGNPLRDSVGRPNMGPMFANWHMGFRCKSVESTGGAAEDYVFGYIGEMVEPPSFDVGGADMHFIMSGFGFQQGPVMDALLASTTASVTPAVTAELEWLAPKDAPRSAARAKYVDEVKGVYESWSTMHFLREAPERTIRLWWQVPVDGSRADIGHDHDDGAHAPPGPWHPVYWDLKVSAAKQYTTPPADGAEWAAHNMLGTEHFPAIFGQPCLTNVYEYASLELTAGEVIESVTIADIWLH